MPPARDVARSLRHSVVHQEAIAAVFFGASMVLSVVAHDAFGLGPERFGFIIAAPGLLWTVAALWIGSHPALDDGPFRRRALFAGAAITVGVGLLLATTLVADGMSTAFTCWDAA